jgi:glycosyltransferase involved in cell wall biosynthesis
MNDRILILIKGLGRGGAEQLLVNAAPYTDRSRFHYEVAYLLPHKVALGEQLRDAGLAVHCLDGAKGPAWVGRLRGLVRARRIDLIHAHSPVAAIGARVGLPRGGPARVYTEHNVWGRYHPATRWANLLTFPRNDHVFAVSEEVRRSIRYPRALDRLPMPPVETMIHGLDLAATRNGDLSGDVRRELGVADDAPVVGTVANFKAPKGYEYMLRAADLTRQSFPDVRFVLVGTGPLEMEIRRQAVDLGLTETVLFTGFREDAARLIRAFDVFAMASLYEGLSIALLEAMAAGRPVVVTRVGGLEEVVRDGEQGLLVPPRDAAALATGLVSLLGDRERRRRMGSAARQRASEFDIRGAVRRMEEVYSSLLRHRTVASRADGRA